MRWFRKNRVLGAQAALFALIVQFSLAFGHVHALDADHSTAVPAGAAAAAFDIAIDHRSSPVPSDHGPYDPADSACALCATIQLTGAAQVAMSPALPFPVAYGVTELSLASEMALDDPRCFEHRSRGPPQA